MNFEDIMKEKENKKRSKLVKRVAPLIAYFQENGTIENIKQSDLFEYNGKIIKIGLLVSNLRRDKKEGKLTDADVNFLDYLGMDWGYNFDRYLKLLNSHYLEYGTLANLTQYHKELGGVLSTLREDYRNGNLTFNQIIELEEMGIIWQPKSVQNVLKGLRAYYEIYGSISDIKADDTVIINEQVFNVGKQLNHFKTKYNKGELKQEYITALNKMGIDWGNQQIKDSNEREI